VLGLADWVIRMDDGRLNLLGLVDDGPTGLASAHWGGSTKAPGRGAANSIQVLLDAWSLCRADRYLAKADELIRRCIHPADDVAAIGLLDAERNWSYTMFLAAIDRYLAMKAEADQLDGMYAYAQASLLRYARWMLDHERPYLDARERLEYPTETWPAQDLRKANVLRQAARHAKPGIAAALLRRGDETSCLNWPGVICCLSKIRGPPVRWRWSWWKAHGTPAAIGNRILPRLQEIVARISGSRSCSFRKTIA
jgi:hypothetical protein